LPPTPDFYTHVIEVVDAFFSKQLSMRMEDALGFLQSRELNEQLILRLLDALLVQILPEIKAETD
jgi:hypothetical protein